MKATSDETLSDTTGSARRPRSAPELVTALVVAWSADEPHRIGEVAIPPPGSPGAEVVWGRGGDDGHAHRLLHQRHRPGRVFQAGQVSTPRVSRHQLRVRARADQGLEITNVGRAPVLHNGALATSFVAVPGDVIEIGRQIAFMCLHRPLFLPGAGIDPGFSFGEPDAHGIVGESPAIWELRRRVTFVGPQAGHVLVCGESGTGKELVARALHATSPRAAAPLVARNAATLPEGLVDAELFGNLKNYPNPGTPERAGLIGEADGSTFFLDEIGEISAATQAHLLRVLDGGEYHRLGEARPRSANLRLIAATNRPESALKHDLLARFVFRIDVPALDGRREDIPRIALHLLRGIASSDAVIAARFFEGGVPRVSLGFVRRLVQRTYSTHVRELSALLWQALLESRGDWIEEPEDAFSSVELSAAEPPAPDARRSAGSPAEAALSPSAIQAVLDAHNGVIEDAWRALDLSSRHALTRLIKKHGIEIRRRRR